MITRKFLCSTISIAALAAALPGAALAADPYSLSYPSQMPAVSAVNGKLGLFGGSVGGETAIGLNGSLAFPLHDQFGAQVDGLFGTAGGGVFYGAAGHLFWRDPSVGFLGGYASYVGWGDGVTTIGGVDDAPLYDIAGARVARVGIEGEAYLGRLSLEAAAAYQAGSNTGFAGRTALAYYATDDLRLDIGYNYLQGPGGSFTAGAEWQLSNTGSTVFADAAYKSSDSWSAVGGIRMYFGGEQKSLIRRHREDDPDNLLPGDLYTIVGEAYCPVDHTLLDGFCDSNS